MEKDDILYQLRQAAISFRHLSQSIRKGEQNIVEFGPPTPIPANTADFHASQIEEIINLLTQRFEVENHN